MNKYLQSVDLQSLSETDKLIYDYILRNESKVKWMTLEELCEDLYVSNASIVRFCQHIGLKGYNDLKFMLRSNRKESDEAINTITRRQLAQFNDSISAIRQEDIEIFYDLLMTHRKLCIYGRNLSSVPATYMYDMLMSIDFPCVLIDWSDALKAISENADKDTLLLMISEHAHDEYFPIIEEFKAKKASVIWICGVEVDKKILDNIDLYIQADPPNADGRPSTKITTLMIIQMIIEYIQKTSLRTEGQGS